MTRIKEIKLKLKIKNKEFMAHKLSQFINGHLESITYNIKQGPINFGIYPERFKHITLTERFNIDGVGHLVLRAETHSEKNEKFNFTQDKWALNDRLFFLIEGLPASEVEFVIRHS